MSIHNAHRRHHREPFPAPPSPGIYRKIAYSFVALTVIIVFAALWFSSVRATVTVKATREATPVEASVDVARSPAQGQLPGRVVQGVFEKIQEFVVTGQGATAEDTVVTGKARITNTTSKDQPLIKTTRLLTADGRLYRISSTVTVPAKGSVDVEAYSDKAEKQYVLPAGTKFTIPGLSESLQKLITAESLNAFAGGQRTVKALTQGDVDAAEKELEKAVTDQAKKTLLAEVGDGRFTEAVYLVKTIDKKSNVKLGEEADRFLMSLKLDVTGVFYPKVDMESLVRERINERVPEGRSIVSYEPSKTVFTVSQVDVKNERATVTLKADVTTKLSDKSPNLTKDLIAGLPIDEAEQKLKSVEGVESASITVRPSWVRRLPTLKDHITFKIE
ncbi:hypothetical protein A3E39_01970 [Candidatus Uhrbacteria bacterium RIFCSPHIGHO2_12_FULL_60_25]|uniref:Baseplate protein J-like domain-containing protein n=1 Tax=Candidatus Uhrbacteria bacterium RIFCSPHIGHO2_12_FULL_60_25 TaxID=1802399 RepID=A0A1F7UME1_9BACT|nr:MAG: hypothetical protein A3D73_04340 [Candidatus Uhrbacteria bacterium RIFCSPHIGHO2_02_FULL_60_44]OGL78934.1 MAG: hypothetical protein A3E39_01970 [Candidatus Uhrbacteria bacterium RIFCSPHIGHO2_12_FULL_60_25]